MSIITRVISTFGPRSPVRDIPPTPPFAQEEGAEVAIFALGPFHSAELLFVQNFSHRGLRASTVGYIGGRSSGGGAPSYSRVLSGTSGHALAVRLEYDPKQISYAALVDFFYRIHDPTKRNAQGPDRGTHYRSAIFCLTPEQRDIARRITAEVQKIRFTPKGQTIVTKLIGPSEEQGGIPDWYDAEEEHQKYHFLYPDAPRCPTHKMHW